MLPWTATFTHQKPLKNRIVASAFFAAIANFHGNSNKIFFFGWYHWEVAPWVEILRGKQFTKYTPIYRLEIANNKQLNINNAYRHNSTNTTSSIIHWANNATRNATGTPHWNPTGGTANRGGWANSTKINDQRHRGGVGNLSRLGSPGA